ncbi:MAG TPA: hypothetical protein ENO20_15045 [Bacteroides sp.]|nr:hypothetical protein [Bacteroides sp.]
MKTSRLHIALLNLAGILLLVPLFINAQTNTLYLLHQVPQSNLLNPAVQLACKWYVGIPGLSSVHAAYHNTAFTWNDLASSSEWNLYGILDQMHRADLVSVEAEIHPVAIGYRHGSNYFTFNLSDRAQFYPTFPGDLAETVLRGNVPFVGKTAHFNALRPNGYYLREYAFGISRVLGPSWVAGLRASLLFGKGSLYTGRSRSGLTTDEQTFMLRLEGDYTLHSSLPVTIEQDTEGDISGVVLNAIDYYRMLMNRGNPGIALDLGAIYRYDEKITLSASLLDLGLVRWNTDLNNIRAAGSFRFEGIDPDSELVSGPFVREMRDSVLGAFDVTVTRLPYHSSLPVQLFLGGSYRVSDLVTLGAVNRNVFYRSKLHSSVTLTAHADLFDRFLAGLSWSLMNNSMKNVGAVIAYHGRGFQFHLVSDNLFGFFYPFDTRSINLRTGFNLMLGCPRNRKGKIEPPSYGPGPGRGDCAWAEKAKFRKKYSKRAKWDP